MEGLKIETGLLFHKMQTYISQKAKAVREKGEKEQLLFLKQKGHSGKHLPKAQTKANKLQTKLKLNHREKMTAEFKTLFLLTPNACILARQNPCDLLSNRIARPGF